MCVGLVTSTVACVRPHRVPASSPVQVAALVLDAGRPPSPCRALHLVLAHHQLLAVLQPLVDESKPAMTR
jgi:hypothetical protein